MKASGNAAPMTVTIDLRGAVAPDASMRALAEKIGNAIVRQLRPGDDDDPPAAALVPA